MTAITKPLIAVEEADTRGAINYYQQNPDKPFQQMVFKDTSWEWYNSLSQQLGMGPMPQRTHPGPTPVPPPSGPVIYMDMDVNNRQDTVNNHTPFAANGILVCKFTVPAGVTFPVGSQGWLQYAEFVDAPYTRQVSLSNQQCDFRGAAIGANDTFHADPTGMSYPLAWAVGNANALNYTVNGTLPHVAQLTPGVWYYNIRNWDQYANNGQGGCPQVATCNIVVTYSPPK